MFDEIVLWAALAAWPNPRLDPALVGRSVAETAMAQVFRADAAWPEAERDCAGLVRFAYRSAYRKLAGRAAADGLFLDSSGRPSAFADAETLLARSFVRMGRGAEARAALESGDLLAFRREASSGPIHHLMLIAKGSRLGTVVVYHPGQPGAEVRLGTLAELENRAPREWRPVPDNPHFLGYFRYKEWAR